MYYRPTSSQHAVKARLDELFPPPPDEEGWTYANPNPRAKVKRNALAALQAYGVNLPDVKSKTLANYLRDEGEDEFVRTLKDYRDLGGITNRQRGFLKDAVAKGRIHCQLHSYGTETGRITTSNPNLQGLDKKHPTWRACIRDPKGQTSILSADLDQIELRILARVSSDEELLSVYRDGKEDLHTSTARDATGEKGITKKSPKRTIAKSVNFGIAYGATPYGIYTRLREDGYNVTKEDVEAFVEAFFDKFPQVQTWQNEYGNLDDFDTTSLLGRHRTVSPILRGKRQGWPNREERLNGPIQTTGADILKMILIRLSEEEPPYARLLLPVHDEVLVEVEKGYEKEASSWVSKVMTEAVTEVLGAELARDCVEVEGGESWGRGAA